MVPFLVLLSVLLVIGLAIALLPRASSTPARPAVPSIWTPPSGIPAPPRRPSFAPRPAPIHRNGHPSPPRGRSGKGEPRGHALDAQKTVRAFDFVLKAFGQLPAWRTSVEMDGFIHDLSVMLDEKDLERASIELLGHDQTVLYRYRIEFRQASGRAGVDAAQGIELPMIPADRIAGHRLLVYPVARVAEYRHRLRRRWGNAEKLTDRAGSRFASQHTRRVNRDRMTGEVFVSDEARCTATIVTVSAAGDYAFARTAALPVDVYLHRAIFTAPSAMCR